MARTDSLGNFLTDVADAIRTKKGSSDTILASDFDTEIANLPSGADLSNYFTNTISSGTGEYTSGYVSTIKKTPAYTNSGTSCEYMFCMNYFTEIDVSNFDTSNVTTMKNMFSNSRSIVTLNLSNFNTEKVTTMSTMFAGCQNLETLDLSNFYTPALFNTSYMFERCAKLTFIDMRNFYFDGITNKNSMFSSVPNNCLIVVKDNSAKNWINTNFSNLTNVKTVAEYEAE